MFDVDPDPLPPHFQGQTIVYNATGSDLIGMVNSQEIRIPARRALTTSRVVAHHLLRRFRRFGLVECSMVAEPKDLDVQGIRALVSTYRQTIAAFEKENSRLKELKAEPLEKDPSIVKAEAELPIYEAWLTKTVGEKGVEEAKAAAEAAASMLDEKPEIPTIAKMNREQLRAHLSELGVPWDPVATVADLRQLVKAHYETAAASPLAGDPEE